MKTDVARLLSAVAKAAGRELKIDHFEDRLIMQKGCYILNSWGCGPKFRFNMYVRGPYSTTLADEYYSLGDVTPGVTDIPDVYVNDLSEILGKGLRYAEAYATVLMIKNNSPGGSYEGIMRRALDLKPHLKKEVEEASLSLLN